jgi:membrane-associated protein
MHNVAAQVLANPISPHHLLDSFGSFALLGVALILFAECGLLVGFFLPGDTLLFSVGLLLAIGQLSHVPLGWALIVLPVAAILGNMVGYWIGLKAGPKVFDRPNSRLFKPEYVTRSHDFFEKFGPATIILARFVPIVRTVATVMAGVSRMRFSLYLLYSIIGGALWADGVLMLGYWLGHIEFVRKTVEPLIDPILVCIVLVSVLPTALHWWRSRRSNPATETEI